jgi:CRISPR system Cascade subunit CasD
MGGRCYLVFRIATPIGAFGDIAVGERRATWDVPSKSGVMGLIAAALGIERTEMAAHQRLDAGLGFAVRQDHAGRPLRDYHTAQTPKASRGKSWRTRREELEADNLNTVLSERIYRVEPEATVVLWSKTESGELLTNLEEALKRPKFTLYVGRKACPLGWPPRPRVISAESVNAALASFDALELVSDQELHRFRPRRWESRTLPVWVEAGTDAETAEAGPARERRQRRDGLMNRSLWQFTDRTEIRFDFVAPAHKEETL